MRSTHRDDGLASGLAVGAVTTLLAIVAVGLALAAVFLVGWMGQAFWNVAAPANALPFLILILAVDGACFACALGLPNRKAWAWTGVVTLALLGFGAFLFSRLPGSFGLIGLAVSFGALVALFLPSTRRRFER
jgi:fucose 4-O-acetylase-like acetyltransferase